MEKHWKVRIYAGEKAIFQKGARVKKIFLRSEDTAR